MPNVPIYRIVHLDNLNQIVKNGKLVCPAHLESNENYKSIGNNSIISSRSEKALPFNPSRTFKNYIVFYFGMRSIMLYNIHSGFGEVEQIHQSKIIYLQSNTELIEQAGLNYFFTDGHALQYPITQSFHDLNDLDKVNFRDAYAKDFSTLAELTNPGIKRRKQSEFHVYHEMNWNLINEIIVINENIANKVARILDDNNSQKRIKIDTSFYF